LIWGTPAQEIPRLGDYEHLNSRRAGGEYKVTGSDVEAVRSLTELFRGRLSDAEFQASEANLADFVKARGNTKPHLACLM
jgi:hypothetical protein